MWHRKKRHRLGVKTKHRKALLRNLVRALATHRQIQTTVARAKETSRLADKMVTIAKRGTLFARRELIRHLGCSKTARVFIEEIAPRLQDRNGGYTRVLKMGSRPGDGGEKALVEFSVPIEIPSQGRKAKKEKVRPAKPVVPKEEKKEAKKEAKKEEKKEAKKEETEKRGGFLSKLRNFLTGSDK